MEQQSPTGPQPLRPFVYPIWIWAFTIAVATAVVYALMISPKYIEAARTLRAAGDALEACQWGEAKQLYREVLQTVPGSKAARIGAAQAIFSDHDDSNDLLGMSLLQGLTLKSDEWARISKNMPPQYRRQFQTTPGH